MSNNKELMRFGSKSLVLTVALALILCGTIGGTIAWMMAKSDPVTNTFTYGDIKIKLSETDTQDDEDGDTSTNSYSMALTNNGIIKDPAVIVLAGSEKCWLFIKVTESGNFDDFLTYTIPTGKGAWTLYSESDDGVETVYYRIVEKANVDREIGVLKDDRVYIKDDVTQQQLDDLKDGEFPTLTISAYAVQYAQIDNVDEAWAKVPK